MKNRNYISFTPEGLTFSCCSWPDSCPPEYLRRAGEDTCIRAISLAMILNG